MTEEELKKKAEEYQTGRKDLNYFSEPYKDKIRKAYIAGAKENQPNAEEMLKRLMKGGYIESGISKEISIVWHDLRKDPNDLPTRDNTDMSDYVITDRGVGYYNARVKSWWVRNDYALTDKVIAWCEIPKYEVKE